MSPLFTTLHTVLEGRCGLRKKNEEQERENEKKRPRIYTHFRYDEKKGKKKTSTMTRFRFSEGIRSVPEKKENQIYRSQSTLYYLRCSAGGPNCCAHVRGKDVYTCTHTQADRGTDHIYPSAVRPRPNWSLHPPTERSVHTLIHSTTSVPLHFAMYWCMSLVLLCTG